MTQSLLGSTVSGQTREAEQSVRAKEEAGKEGERGEEQVMSVRLGVSRHGEERGEEKTAQWRENWIRLSD